MRRLLITCLIFSLLLAACAPAAPTSQPTTISVPPAQPGETVISPTEQPTTESAPVDAEQSQPTPVPVRIDPVPNELVVDVSEPQGEISPLLFGTNYGPWVALPPMMIEHAVALGPTVVRWPGGEWGDNNDVKPYQVDQLVAFSSQMGAVPSIHVRLKKGTAEAAADLVRYANMEKGYGIQYWAIGNEPTLFAAALQEEYDTERFNREWREIALAIKAVDDSILLVGPELHQFSGNEAGNPKDSAGRDWMIEFLKANGDLVDIVSFHRYPFGDARITATIEDLRQNAYEWDSTMAYLRELMQEYAGREYPIAITEVNSHWSKAIQGEATPDSHYNAIWWADVLGRMIDNDVFMINHWMLTSQAGQGGWGLIGREVLRPAYFTYMLYKQFGNQQVGAASGVEHLSIYAAERGDGALTIMLINLADEPQSAPLLVRGMTPSSVEAYLLDSKHNAVQVETAVVYADGQVSLPAQSVTLLLVR
jgi:hypothetical protein